ncbi:snoRNA-binding rRNA-processing protein UTP6 KNAG_0C02740 [Huiozyma naganishii CBS 8797]|uniref:U3 small nucleolar RNA-associated protein 6 N-terminal domain-containing protein n=1 Tax=Huiozyma naganishii (strain ATCC MYA-139 / BCRC 22969 / CBS 8797 / KCTC 17520 / NBRC 10181 / NCYC 3082 / Yp74L-3) TaxID=1071383 RepID=J7R3H5_HUIN7|nr:hypothetical protein KNAG_0C02740 [Kazachstania naganishii CBS 8797]CCK69385.1 hypothetical protein KNAG_0C02740 [Kazachstania naganishii CBS 8797]
MSSKTRYYLEQCIPELDDLVEKGLFTKTEVSKIMKKRTDFEHRLNSRGSSITDYMKYISYESNVDKLRLKRCKRILQNAKANGISDWSIQQRINFIYQRGTNKFPQDLKFWSQYLHFLKSRGNSTSYKKIHTVYNQLLRLHPSNADIWISCAKYEYEVHANFKSCRIAFQNALRFNPDVKKLWYEYAKFELSFVTKLIERRRVMNLINEREQELDMLNDSKDADGDQTKEEEKDDSPATQNVSTGDHMKDKLNELPEADMSMLGTFETNPALRGDIALTIFDIAMKSLGEQYLNKQKGYYAVSDKQTARAMNIETVEYLFTESVNYINLFDEFKVLSRDYLINHIIQYWRNEHYSLTLKKDFPRLYAELLIIDITLNVRYMTVETLDIDQLQLSVKKYIAYNSKLEANVAKAIQTKYKTYIQERFIENMDAEDDPRTKILELIVKKL